jgi:hypothetical protein
LILAVLGAKKLAKTRSVSRQRLMPEHAAKLHSARIALFCAGAGGLGLASATAPRLTPVLTAFASVFTPFVTAFASVFPALHSSCLSLCI